jgi:hypothetical protein
MPATTMRLDGATVPSRPSADAGTSHGMAAAAPARAMNERRDTPMPTFETPLQFMKTPFALEML